MLTHEDKELLAKKGISEAQIAEQLACFEKGFPFLQLSAAASIGNGILNPDAPNSSSTCRHGMLTCRATRRL